MACSADPTQMVAELLNQKKERAPFVEQHFPVHGTQIAA
jgi:hypothetical protein